jgi:hypothetical protein
METRKLTVGLIDRSVTLDCIPKAVTVPACEVPATPVKLGNPPPAIDATGMNVADEPGPFSA